MNYENRIVIHRKAIKSIEKLSEKERIKIKQIITSLKAFPLIRHGIVKLKGFEDTYRVRVGKLRIIFRFIKKRKSSYYRGGNTKKESIQIINYR